MLPSEILRVRCGYRSTVLAEVNGRKIVTENTYKRLFEPSKDCVFLARLFLRAAFYATKAACQRQAHA